MKQSGPILNNTISRVERVTPIAYAARLRCINVFREFDEERAATWDKRFSELHSLEADLEEFLSPGSEDLKKLREDALAQLSFTQADLRCLNYVPFALAIVAGFKVWAVPLMAILTPLLAWILPYIFLKFMYQLPISTEQYSTIVKLIWSGSPFQFKTGPNGKLMAPEAPSFFTPRNLFQSGLVAFSFLHGLIQPIQNAYHLHKTDRTFYEKGAKAIRIFQLYTKFLEESEELGTPIYFRDSLEDIEVTDPRRTIHLLLEQPERFRIACRDLASLEIQWRIARCPLLHPAMVIERGEAPYFEAIGMFDISLEAGTAKPSDVSFTGKSHHAALTGPNGGGKSSFMRAVLQTTLLAQTYGVAPAERCALRRFGWIRSGLRLQDSPGTLSMFETEVAFAARLLRTRSPRGPGLVLYDELFHSTNPPDGTATAKRFLEGLWARDDMVTIVSTHVFELVEAADEKVQRLCCQAQIRPDGELAFGYSVEKGICRLSSVRGIWRRFGLEGEAKPADQV
jgi:hypothetical protein